MLAGGLGTLAFSVLAVSVVGGTRLKRDPDDRFWRRMLIPVAGGFAAMPVADDYQAKWGAAFLGTLQVAASVTTIAGATIMLRHPRPITAFATPTRDGAHVSVAFRF